MSGAIAFASAAAAAGGGSTITAQAVFVSDVDNAIASAGIRYRANGTYDSIIGIDALSNGAWVQPQTKAHEWEIRATRTSGLSPTGSPLNTWLPLTTDRVWSLTRSSTGAFQSRLTFEFRRVGATDPEVTIALNELDVEVL